MNASECEAWIVTFGTSCAIVGLKIRSRDQLFKKYYLDYLKSPNQPGNLYYVLSVVVFLQVVCEGHFPVHHELLWQLCHLCRDISDAAAVIPESIDPNQACEIMFRLSLHRLQHPTVPYKPYRTLNFPSKIWKVGLRNGGKQHSKEEEWL